jgi:hypothetical protein
MGATLSQIEVEAMPEAEYAKRTLGLVRTDPKPAKKPGR